MRRKLLTLDDLKEGDIIDPIPYSYFLKPLLISKVEGCYFFIKDCNKEIKYHKRVLKYFIKRKLKNK